MSNELMLSGSSHTACTLNHNRSHSHTAMYLILHILAYNMMIGASMFSGRSGSCSMQGPHLTLVTDVSKDLWGTTEGVHLQI